MIPFIPYITMPISLSLNMVDVNHMESMYEFDKNAQAWNMGHYCDRPVVVFNESHKPHLGIVHKSLSTHDFLAEYVLIPPFYDRMHFTIANRVIGMGGYTFYVDLTPWNVGDFSDEMATYYLKQKKNGN